MEDNHLFGEDSEIAEGATEKMITGGHGGMKNWVERRWRESQTGFFGAKKMCVLHRCVFKGREIVLEMCIG